MPYKVVQESPVDMPRIVFDPDAEGYEDPYCKEILLELHKKTAEYNEKYAKNPIGVCSFCGGPTPCLNKG